MNNGIGAENSVDMAFCDIDCVYCADCFDNRLEDDNCVPYCECIGPVD